MDLSRLKVKDLLAWIEIDGRELTCYNVTENVKEGNISCWIASEEGKNFAVRIKQGKTKYWTQATLILDGHELYPKTELNPGEKDYTLQSITSLRRDKAEMPFMFARRAPLGIGNAEEINPRISTGFGHEIETKQEPGTIRLEIRRETPSLPLIVRPKENEKTKKNEFQHQIVYGEPREVSQNGKTYILQGGMNNTIELIATFTFKYQPIEVLRARGFAPQLGVSDMELAQCIPEAPAPTERTAPRKKARFKNPIVPTTTSGEPESQASTSKGLALPRSEQVGTTGEKENDDDDIKSVLKQLKGLTSVVEKLQQKRRNEEEASGTSDRAQKRKRGE